MRSSSGYIFKCPEHFKEKLEEMVGVNLVYCGLTTTLPRRCQFATYTDELGVDKSMGGGRVGHLTPVAQLVVNRERPEVHRRAEVSG